MSERKRPDGRGIWPAWKRVLVRVGRWLYDLGPACLLTKHEDGTIGGSMTRWAVLIFTFVMALRLIPLPEGWHVAPMGWPETFALFFVLYALALNDALTTVARQNPEKLVESLLSRMGVGSAGGGSSAYSPIRLPSEPRATDEYAGSPPGGGT